jgi:serine/threonine protein kinase/TolB-like protein/tetratricopeptide (TPR) repeat protein
MKPERDENPDKVFKTFQAAVELEGESRHAFLDQACAGDPELRKEVESLLVYDEKGKSFIESPAFEEAAELMVDYEGSTQMMEAVGPFKIVSQLGSGGMGEVYLAEDSRLGRKVALKLLDRNLIGDSQSRGRFLREARLASALDHPNICTIHEIGEASGLLFIAMQFVEGETLKKAIGDRPLSLVSLLSISLQVANGLAAAHARGTIHRDIKSNNIMITPHGQAKVLDFGLARPMEKEDGETELTRAGAVMGTPTYMSPEQARGDRADHRSDIFSFGVVIYEMATGRTPFKAKSRTETMNAVINQPHMPVVELSKDIPTELSAVIDRALAKQPADRYQSVEEMTMDLREVARSIGLVGSNSSDPMMVPYVPPARSGRLTRWIETNVRRPAVVAVFGAILVALAMLVYTLLPKATVPPAGFKSIAVLPFKPLLVESRDEMLEMGMADTLIARLSNISEINVRPISSVRKYAGVEQDALAAGREQGVDAVLDGQIQRSGDAIRVTVRLVRVKDGGPIWSSQFDEKMTNIFRVQDSISERVAGVLALRLTGEEKGQLTKRSTENTEAYQLYLKGRFHINRLTDDGFLKARDYFQQAIDKDPRYALAYAGLADAYQTLSGWNVLSATEALPKADAAARKAIELDDTLAEAHAVFGIVKLFYDRDWQSAEREFKRALELNPNYADAHRYYSFYLSPMRRFDEAHAEVRRAQELDPLSIDKVSGIAEVYYFQGDFDRAIEQYRKAVDLDPNSGFAHWALANALTQRGMYAQAIEEYKKSIPLSGDSPDEPAMLACAYAMSGNKKEARKILAELNERSRRQYIAPTSIAFVHIALGEKDEAFAILDRALVEHDTLLTLLNVEPFFGPLRGDPRFQNLLRRVGLPE